MRSTRSVSPDEAYCRLVPWLSHSRIGRSSSPHTTDMPTNSVIWVGRASEAACGPACTMDSTRAAPSGNGSPDATRSAGGSRRSDTDRGRDGRRGRFRRRSTVPTPRFGPRRPTRRSVECPAGTRLAISMMTGPESDSELDVAHAVVYTKGQPRRAWPSRARPKPAPRSCRGSSGRYRRNPVRRS